MDLSATPPMLDLGIVELGFKLLRVQDLTRSLECVVYICVRVCVSACARVCACVCMCDPVRDVVWFVGSSEICATFMKSSSMT